MSYCNFVFFVVILFFRIYVTTVTFSCVSNLETETSLEVLVNSCRGADRLGVLVDHLTTFSKTVRSGVYHLESFYSSCI